MKLPLAPLLRLLLLFLLLFLQLLLPFSSSSAPALVSFPHHSRPTICKRGNRNLGARALSELLQYDTHHDDVVDIII